MPSLLPDIIIHASHKTPDSIAIKHKQTTLSYGQMAETLTNAAAGLIHTGLRSNERVGIYLPKLPESVLAFFAASHAGGVFVPINPLLKAPQVSYILDDCNVRILVTSKDRLLQLEEQLKSCRDLHTIILVDNKSAEAPQIADLRCLDWQELLDSTDSARAHQRIDSDIAAILYTSGSTGKPKGVVLSHQNILAGAKSVSQYLRNTAADKLLCVLPFSFDYGFSQLTTAFHVGASAVLMDYLLPRDVVKMVAKESITGLAGVPPLWNQLAQLEWPEEAVQSLRYMSNSGGAMPQTSLQKLRSALPQSQFYLMYGLTEAFRSTYLPPEEIDRRPDSMGKAIPNAEVMVVREDGSPCAPGEPGELVHRGSLVALGYWNDAEKTAERFKPAPGQSSELSIPEIAVWSGDTVKMDEDGYLYFVGRKDDMIKTSGYRVSPTEIEEVIYASGLVGEAIALGIPHPTLGQAILVVATANKTGELDAEQIINRCKQTLPNFMVPHAIEKADSLPRNPNGKIDRKSVAQNYQDLFAES